MNHLGNRLAAYVDGELPRVTRELISAHLLMCSGCRAAVEAESRTKTGLTRLGAPDPSAHLMGALLELAAPGEPMPPRRRPLCVDPSPRSVPVGKPVRIAFLGVTEPALPFQTRGSRVRRSLLAAGAMGIAAVTLASAHAQNTGGTPVPPPDGGSFAQVVGPQTGAESTQPSRPTQPAPSTQPAQPSVDEVFGAPADLPKVESPSGATVFYGHVHTR